MMSVVVAAAIADHTGISFDATVHGINSSLAYHATTYRYRTWSDRYEYEAKVEVSSELRVDGSQISYTLQSLIFGIIFAHFADLYMTSLIVNNITSAHRTSSHIGTLYWLSTTSSNL